MGHNPVGWVPHPSVTESLLCTVPQIPVQKADQEPFMTTASGPERGSFWEEAMLKDELLVTLD